MWDGKAPLYLAVNLPVEVQSQGKGQLKGDWKGSSVLEKGLRDTDIFSCQMCSLRLRKDWPDGVRTEVERIFASRLPSPSLLLDKEGGGITRYSDVSESFLSLSLGAGVMGIIIHFSGNIVFRQGWP